MIDRIAIAEENYLATFRRMTELLPGGIVLERGGALHLHSGASLPPFNPTILQDGAGDVSAALDAAATFHAAHGSPAWVVLARAGDTARIEAAARDRGFTPGGDMPFMVLDAIQEADLPKGLSISRVEGTEDLRLHFEIVAQAFDFPFSLIEKVCDPAILSGAFGIFVGWVDGQAVATALYSVSDGGHGLCAGVYNICTLPSHRGRGLGRAMTAYAAAAARSEQGCTIATLQASAMGFPVYERMGYREVDRWQFWSPPA